MSEGGKKSPWWIWLLVFFIPGGFIFYLLFTVGKKVYKAESLNKSIASITTTGVKPGTDPLGAKAAVATILTDQAANTTGTVTQAQLQAIADAELASIKVNF